MSTKETITTNLFWRFMERCGAQGVTFIVSIVLARLLDPSVYGTVALVTVFTSIMQVFVDSGLGVSLIQKKDSDDTDFSTVFYFNIVMCSLLYLAMFFAAPFIADFYKSPELTPIIRVLSLTLVISGLKNVQQAYVSKKMLFKRFFWATLGGTTGAAVVGIAMAYFGFGVWALVAQHLFNLIVDTLILWITVKWRPKLTFSLTRLKTLFAFGWKMLFSAIIDTVYKDLRQLIIGKIYTENDLAFYNRGYQFPNMIVSNINTSIDSVLLPAVANVQDNKDKVKSITRRAIVTSTFIILPLLTGLAGVAAPLVKLLLTDKWLPCVPFMQIFCFVYALMPVHTANLQAIKAMGRSDLYLKMEIIKKIIGLTSIFITMNISVLAMAIGSLFVTLFSSIVNAFPNKKLLDYGFLEQIKDMLPSICISAVMLLTVLALGMLPIDPLFMIIIQVMVGAAVYIGLARLFKLECFYYVLNTIKGFIKRR